MLVLGHNNLLKIGNAHFGDLMILEEFFALFGLLISVFNEDQRPAEHMPRSHFYNETFMLAFGLSKNILTHNWQRSLLYIF